MALLIFQRGRHEQGKDLIEERTRTEVSRLVGNLTESGFPLGRRSVLDLEQHPQNLALLRLLGVKLFLLRLIHKFAEVLQKQSANRSQTQTKRGEEPVSYNEVEVNQISFRRNDTPPDEPPSGVLSPAEADIEATNLDPIYLDLSWKAARPTQP